MIIQLESLPSSPFVNETQILRKTIPRPDCKINEDKEVTARAGLAVQLRA